MNNCEIISKPDRFSSEALTEFKYLPCIEAKNEICPLCGSKHISLSMQEVIAVGFGNALLTKNGECVYSESQAQSCSDYISVAEAEELAASEPDYDWRIHLVGVFSAQHYQRQGACHWVLYKKGKGIA